MTHLLRNAFRTPDGTVSQSTNVHECHTHEDENGKSYMIDGGVSYSRRSAHGDEVDMCLYSDTTDHKVQREILEWGSYGKDGKSRLKRIRIACMDTSHIEAVLREANPSITFRVCMELELELRNMEEL